MDNQETNYQQPTTDVQAGYGSPPNPDEIPNKLKNFSSQDTLPIAEIKDGIVILKDGSFRAVISAEAINFDLMSGGEREAVEYAYQAFINSLYFPIQIQVQSRRIDAGAYLKKLESSLSRQNNMLLSVLMEDYLNFIINLVEESDIMNKDFYVIVPFYNDALTRENMAKVGKNFWAKLRNFNKKSPRLIIDEKTFNRVKRELRYYTQVVLDGLNGCGVRSHVLNTQELIKMYYEFYNHEAGATQHLNNFNQLTTPYVEGHKASPEIELSPEMQPPVPESLNNPNLMPPQISQPLMPPPETPQIPNPQSPPALVNPPPINNPPYVEEFPEANQSPGNPS